MNHTSRQCVAAAVPQACLAASAGLHDLDGHAVIAHYGSVPGEMSVCMTSVGLADRSDYSVFELRGDRAQLDRFLIARLGDPPLAVGSGRRLRDVWYLRLAARRIVLAGPRAAMASRSAAVGRGVACGELRRREIAETLAIVAIVGPRAARLLVAADLPGDLPIGAVAAGAADGGVVAILRESQRRYLALVHAGAADAFWMRLRAAGEPLGAAFVGYDALTLLDASPVAGG